MAILMRLKISASSLVEVIVALIIISIVFGISTMIYINVLNSTYSVKQLQHSMLLKAICEETINKKRYFDETIKSEDITVFKKVTKVTGYDKLLHLHVEIVEPNTYPSIYRDQLIIFYNGQD
jgi:Tfp pilus assembly protein PilV